MADDADPTPPDPQDDYLGGSHPVLGSGAGWSSGPPAGPGPDPSDPHPFDAPEPDRYVRRQTLGQGGMGRVVAVFDRRLEREVALKELRPSSDDPSLGRRRLAREAHITAQLDHPGIVPILDAGRGPDGRLFYTMPIVRGRTLAAAMADAPDLDARLALVPRVLAASQAVAYAHQHGILHRDLKPSNILVGALGETQVVDWGLARSLHAPVDVDPGPPPAASSLTAHGGVLGTPHYMSPEQANGLEVGCPSDVWSLGVVLYELITGQRPFPGDSAQEVLAEVRRAAPPPADTLVPSAPHDLLAIVDRALEHGPRDRYPDAHALAADLQRYLTGQQVHARTYSASERAWRAALAWRRPLLAATAALLLVVATAVAAWLQTVAERDRARLAEHDARVALAEADRSLARALTLQAAQAARRTNRAEAEILASHALVLEPNPRAWGVLMGLSTTRRPRRVHETRFEAPCPSPMLVDGTTIALCVATDGLSRVDLATGATTWTRPVVVSRVSPMSGGAEVFVLDDRQSTLLVDPDSGSVLFSDVYRSSHGTIHPGPTADAVTILDDRRVRLLRPRTREVVDLVGCSGEAHTAVTRTPGGGLVLLCDSGSWRELGPDLSPRTAHPSAADPRLADGTHVRVSPDGSRFAVATRAGTVSVVDRTDGAVLHHVTVGTRALTRVAWSPDGARLMVHALAGPTVLLDTTTGSIVARLPASGARTGRFVDDQVVELVSETGVVRWAVPRGGVPHLVARGRGVTAVRVAPQGQHLLVCRGDGSLSVRALPSALLEHRAGRDGVVCKDADFLPDGSAAVAGYARAEDLLMLDVDSGASRTLVQPRGRRNRRVFTLQPDIVVGLSYARNGPVATRTDGRPEGALVLPSLHMWEGAASSDHSHAVMVDSGNAVYRLRGGPTPAIEPLFTAETVYATAISRAGTHVLVGTDSGAEEWSAATGTVEQTYTIGSTRAVDLVWSADDRRLAIGDLAGAVWLFTRGASDPIAVLEGHTQMASTLAFAPDGRTLYTGSWDGTVRAWDLDVLSAAPDALLAEAERDWGLHRSQVLGAAGSGG